jgi:outer membrane protein assembly factor BamA
MRAALLLGALCLLLATGLRAQSGTEVYKVTIRHVGPPAVSDSLILANIRIEVGSTYNRTAIDDDLQNLLATGYFYNVNVLSDYDITQGYHLIYLVQGFPTVTDIRFAGNTKYRDSKLLKTISSRVGQPMNEFRLFADRQAIK